MNKSVHADQWLLDHATTARASEAAGPFLSPGRRNNDYASFAGSLFRKGLDVEAVERTLLSVNRDSPAPLRGARLALSSELALGQTLDAPLMKKLTGGDRVTARFLYRENFEFTPTAVPLFVTNALPIIDGGDAAMLRRIVVIGFMTVIPPDERDPTLPEKLKAERSGILNRLLEGMMDYLSTGSLRPPDSVVAATSEYGTNSDLLGLFLADRTVATPNARTGAQVLYSEYRIWCMNAGVRPLSNPQFNNAMKRRSGSLTKRDKSGCWWYGLELRSDFAP